MINPGTGPLDDTREDLAAGNLETFLDAVRDRAAVMGGGPVTRTAELTGPPGRDPAADRDGRYGWDLPVSDGHLVRLLMPGVELTRLRDDITAAAPCLYLNGNAYWWNDAVTRAAAEGLTYVRVASS
jgi:hypothetical protein